MQRMITHVVTEIAPSCTQDWSRTRDRSPPNGTYGHFMPPADDARHAQFSRFVKRAVDSAADTHGWTVTEIAERAGIARSTLYRWLKGDWNVDPKGAEVAAFCDALDIPTTIAFKILWPGKSQRAEAPEALPPADPDFDTLLRKLRDPNVSDDEKYLIRETIRSLAARSRRAG